MVGTLLINTLVPYFFNFLIACYLTQNGPTLMILSSRFLSLITALCPSFSCLSFLRPALCPYDLQVLDSSFFKLCSSLISFLLQPILYSRLFQLYSCYHYRNYYLLHFMTFPIIIIIIFSQSLIADDFLFSMYFTIPLFFCFHF